MAARTVQFGTESVPSIGFGAMGLSAFYGTPTELNIAKSTLRKAIAVVPGGLWNTADMYGMGANEELIGSVLSEGNNRSKVFLVTKWGFRWDDAGAAGFRVCGTAEYAATAIRDSIKRLGCTPDAWALHRIDKNTPIEVSVQAMDKARKEGKTRYIGLSECSAATLRKANGIAKIDFIEVEYSPWTTDMERNGVLAAAKELGIVVLAYSPLGRGFLTGRYTKATDFATEGDFRASLPRLSEKVFEENFKLVEEFKRIAKGKGCTAGQLSLAWLLAQGDNVIPIPGTKSEKYLVENFAATNVSLSSADLKELRAAIEKYAPKEDRYGQGLGMDLLDY